VGIYDRDYTRREEGAGTGEGGLVRGHSTVKVLILANIAIFVVWQLGGAGRHGDAAPWLYEHLTVSARGVLLHLRLHTLLTSAFSHRELFHIFFNMLFLWWFGKELEDSYYGSRNLLFLYLLGAVTASAGHVLLNVAQGVDIPALGASGSVMAILVVCAFLFPDRPIYVFGIVPVALKWLVVGYVALDLLPVLSGVPDGIAHAAHLGGALAGAAFYKLDLRPFHPDGSWRFRLRGGRPGGATGRRGTAPAPGPRPEVRARGDSEVDARVDELLRKISRDGITSLTEEEREFLKGASNRYR